MLHPVLRKPYEVYSFYDPSSNSPQTLKKVCDKVEDVFGLKVGRNDIDKPGKEIFLSVASEEVKVRAEEVRKFAQTIPTCVCSILHPQELPENMVNRVAMPFDFS